MKGGRYMPIANYLHTIVISEYWEEEQWQSWADELILRNDKLENWIYDVAFAKDKEKLYLAIAHEKVIEVFNKETLYCEPDVVIGYYYLMYQEGRMNLSKLFLKLADEDDISSETKLFDFQEITCILNEVRKGKIDIERIDKVLTPLAKIAKKQLEALTNYMRI